MAPVPTPTPEQMASPRKDEEGEGWGRGLGIVINNPITRGILKPLEVLDYPRRLAMLGIEQGALALPDWAEAAAGIPTLGLGSLMLAVDEDKVREDERSNVEKLKDPTYGFGQITGETGNKWLDRTIGFAGDVLLDPVTYATFGTGAVAGKAGKATHLGKLSEKIGRAEAMKALGFADDALPAGLRNLGTMDDVAKMGKRGVHIATNPQLEAMGAGRQGLKLQLPFSSRYSPPIPGTAGAARKFNQATGVAKEKVNQLPGMERLRRTRHPLGFLGNDLGPAYERIITGHGEGTIEEALQAIELDNISRRYGSRFRVTASNEVERLSEKLNKMSDGEVQQLIRQAEVEGKENILTETAERVRQAALDVGVELPKLEAGLYAMPHVLTREARDAILELMEVQSPNAALFKRVTGITDQDLLQESGFLQKRRFVAGTEIPVGDGKKITLETGSVDELNEKLGELLPNFKGKLYETDPGAAWRAYIGGVTKDVAKRRAFREGADRGFLGIARQGDNPGLQNPYVGRDTFVDATTQLPKQLYRSPLKASTAMSDNAAVQEAIADFDALPDDAMVVVYHGTTPENAATIRQTSRVGYNPRGDDVSGVTKSKGTYVAMTPQDAAMYAGRDGEVVELVVRKGDILPSPEIGGGRSVGYALYNPSAGALIPEGGLARPVVDGRMVAPVKEFTQQPIDTRGNRYFRYVEDDVETKKVSKQIKKAHKELIEEYEVVGEAKRGEIATQLESATDVLVNGVRRDLAEAKDRMNYFSERVQNALLEVDEVRTAQRAAEKDIADLTEAISDLGKLRYGLERTARNRAISRQADILTDIQESVADAIATREVLETYQSQMKQRAHDLAIGAKMEARRTARERINEEAQRLTDKVTRFKKRLNDREQELLANWKRRNGGKNPPTSTQVQNAEAWLREHSDDMLRFRRLEEIRNITRREIVDTRDFIDTLAEQRDYLRRKTYLSPDDAALLRRLDDRTVQELEKLAQLEKRLQGVSTDMGKKVYQRIEDNLRIRAMRADWDTYRTVNMQSEINSLGQARRELADFLAEDSRRRPPGPQAVRLTAEETQELTKARNYLQSNSNARRWVRSEQHAMDARRMELDAKRLNEGGLLRQDGRTPAQVRKDGRVAEKWMKEHPGVGRNVRKARETVQRLERKQQEVIPAPRQAPRGEFFETLDRDMARQQKQLEDIVRREQLIEEGHLPQLNQARRQEGEGRTRLSQIVGGREPETNEAMLDEARGYFERNADIRQERVELEAARKQAREVVAEKQEVMDALGAGYRENYANYRAARSQHEAILERLKPEGARLDYRIRRADEIGTRKPYKASLKKVGEGTIPAYEAQPLHRTVADLQAIIEANPTRNDPLMNRIEAVLATQEQALDTLTRTVDMPQAEAQRLLNAASKGELQPVMKAVLRDGWRQLWDEGDVVISRELEARYHRVVNAMAEPKAMGRLMTAYTNFFKTYATLSPGFHVRNGMSATFMNYSEGVTTATQMRGLRLWRQYAKAENPQEWLRRQPKQVQDAFEATFASGAGGRFFESGVADPGAGAGRLKEAIYSNPATRLSQRVGQDWVEGPVRLGLALHALKQGDGVDGALNRITRIHFDYSQVSQFDERAKRFIPFWTFMSRNLPMQVSQMWTKPRTYQKYNNFLRNFSVPPDEFTPEYILEAGGFDTDLETADWMPGTVAGLPIFLQPDFAHTRLGEDAEKIENVLSGGNIGQILSDFNPALTAPIEYATGRDLFTGRQYQEDDYRKASGAIDTALMPLMAVLGQTKSGADGDVYYQEKGFDALRSLIPILDRTTRLAPTTAGGEMDERQMESVLRFLGAPVRTVSDKQRRNEQRSRYYDLLDERDLQRVLAGG